MNRKLKFTLNLFWAFIAMSLVSPSAKAIEVAVQQEINTVVKKAVDEALPKAIEENANKAEEVGGANDLAIMNKNFGAGIMANFDAHYGGKRVKKASVIGGVVRVDESSQAQVGFMLEAHKFISSPPDSNSRTVHGPFIGIILQDQARVDTAVIGYMWGFRQLKSTQTLNIGAGISVSPSAQVLGDGIVEGQPLPNGETSVRFKNTTKFGFSVITSFGF